MARAFRAEPFIWMAWSLTVLGWILMLSAAAALQQNCNKDTHYALAVGGAVGYQGPVSCHQFYAYVW